VTTPTEQAQWHFTTALSAVRWTAEYWWRSADDNALAAAAAAAAAWSCVVAVISTAAAVDVVPTQLERSRNAGIGSVVVG